MSDNKPEPGDRKSLFTAPVLLGGIVVIVFLAFSFLARRPEPVPKQPAPVPAQKAQPAPAAKPKAAEIVVPPPPVLTRTDLIVTANMAAADFAAGGAMPADSKALVGRKFEIRLPFGCNTLQNTASLTQSAVTYDPDNKSVTLTAQPAVWTSLPLIQDLPDAADIGSVEGFWIPRPWTNSESCPPDINYPIPAIPTPPTAQTLGLAQIFGAGASRVNQHAEHPYQFTLKADDTTPLAHAYNLVLAGTIAGYADGSALKCWMESPEHHPLCLYAVQFSHVAFEDAQSGETLAHWDE
jgi:hypothetical protein